MESTDLTPAREAQIASIIHEFSEVLGLMRTRWARYAEETHPELSGSSILVLQAVMRQSPVTVTGISQRLGMDKAMVSRHISKLREVDLVATEPAPDDRRVVLLTATDRAREVISGLRARATHEYHLRFAGWDDGELDALQESLHRFNSYSPAETGDASSPAVKCALGHSTTSGSGSGSGE